MPRKLAYLLSVITGCATAAPAFAQDVSSVAVTPLEQPQTSDPSRLSGFIGLGGAMTPKYDGSDKYEPNPFVIGNIDWAGMELQLRGTRAKLDLLGPSKFQAGPAFGYRSKRKHKDGSGRVALLPDIKSAVEAGGFIGYRFSGNDAGQGEIAFDLTVLKDVNDAYDGYLATAQISYAALRSRKLSLDADISTTYGSGKYMRTYFGVSPEDASVSGLDSYRPGAGLRDVSAGITAGYRLSERWGLIARLGGSYYVGDVRDSPIVKEGAKFQGTAALGVTFRF